MAEVNINHFDAQTHVYIAYSIKVKISVLASDPAFATVPDPWPQWPSVPDN